MRRTITAITAVMALAGCAANSEVDDLAEPAAAPSSDVGPDLPDCEDVWAVGQKLPSNYKGCYDRSGEGVALSYMNCGGGAGWGDEYLYWFEDGPLRYLTWSADKHNYPAEWVIEDGNEIGTVSGERVLETSMDVCRE